MLLPLLQVRLVSAGLALLLAHAEEVPYRGSCSTCLWLAPLSP